MNNKKITIFVSKISGGGAERSAVNVANYIATQGYNIDLISVKKNKDKKILDSRINYISLNCSRLIFSLPQLIFYIYKNNNKDLHLVPFLNGNNVISIFLKLIFRKFNLTCTIHNPVLSHFNFTTFKDKIIILILLFFKNVPDKYITCSYFIKKELIQNYGFSQKNIKHVYNPLDFSKLKEKSKQKNNFLSKYKKNNKIIISIGRLAFQKNYQSLILKLKNLLINKKIILIILGVGKEFKDLQLLIQKNNLTKKVFLLGYKSNPFSYLKKSDLFILNSRWEGLGSVLIESLYLKVPIICNKCPGGINEIFDNLRNHSIFDFKNQKRLETTINDLLYNKKKFMFKKNLLAKFEINNASSKYLKFILK